MTCGIETGSETRDMRSPFTRLIATGYYDGPTEGFLECEGSRNVYFFGLLDWDDGQDVRGFLISELLTLEFERLVEEFSAKHPPSWPIWVLIQQDASSADLLLEHELPRSRALGVAVARNLLDTILLWRPGEIPDPGEKTMGSLLDRLGIQRKPSE